MNNPVLMTDHERGLLWPNQNSEPDIILSIGTGVHLDRKGRPRRANDSNRDAVSQLIPRRVRRKLVVAYNMVNNALDCDKEWRDFLTPHRHDEKFMKACHRLNIVLDREPPKLDAVSELGSLERETDAYINSGSGRKMHPSSHAYRSPHDHIKAVARRLLASLFYFEELVPSPHSDRPDIICGYIRCRLATSNFASFESIMRSRPRFRVKQPQFRSPEVFPEFNRRSFSASIELRARRGAGDYTIEFRCSGCRWDSISGF